MGSRFVVTKTTRINISGGDWIQAKDQLNIGEALDVEGAGIEFTQKPGESEATYTMSRPGEAAVTRVAVWLHSWSLTNTKGIQVPVTRGTVSRLDEDTFGEIRIALDLHIAKVTALHSDAADDHSDVIDIDAVADAPTPTGVPEAPTQKKTEGRSSKN